MKKIPKKTIVAVGIVLAAVLMCGAFGYMNDPRRSSNLSTGSITITSAAAAHIVRLNYCYNNAPAICIVSFGKDQAGNLLIVIRNDQPAVKQIFLSINQTTGAQLAQCQPVQFSDDLFYCTALSIQDGATTRIDLYSKSDNRLIASGIVLVSVNGTPMVKLSSTPTRRVPVTTSTRAGITATRLPPTRFPTKFPTNFPTQIPGTETPAYPNS